MPGMLMSRIRASGRIRRSISLTSSPRSAMCTSWPSSRRIAARISVVSRLSSATSTRSRTGLEGMESSVLLNPALCSVCIGYGNDLPGIAGLQQVMIEADGVAKKPLRGARPYARDGDEQRRRHAALLAQFARDRVAAHAGHIDVDDQDIGAQQPLYFDDLVAAQHHLDVVSLVAHQRSERVRRVAVVISDEDTQR